MERKSELDLNKISENTIKRYSGRYKELGKSIRTLGWGNKEQQMLRFANTLRADDLNGKSVIDIGCGFGDYFDFLSNEGIQLKSYTGTDINPDFISEGNKTIKEKCEFIEADLLKDDLHLKSDSGWDAGIMLGLLNYNLGSPELNYQYSEKMISNAFRLVNKVLIVDFLSSKLFEGYPKEDFVFYHDPAKMFNLASSLSSNTVLIHDYEPIPQKEFMLFIYK
jgi:SAM-dependent methyltransferase